MGTCSQFCTFLLDGQLFGAPVEKVQEVLLFQPMTRVPLAPDVVTGMMNLRGQIVAAIDLRRRLGLGERPNGQLPMNIVVRTAEGPVSLQVDEIGDVIEVSERLFEDPPEILRGLDREAVRGVYKLGGRLLLVLDIDCVLDLREQGNTRADETT